MAQALRIRLAGQKDEILKMVKIYGKFRTATVYGVKDTIAWDRLLYEWTGKRAFGLESALPYSNNTSLEEHYEPAMDLALQRIDTFISNLKARIKTQTDRIAYLEKQLQLYKRMDDERNTAKVLRLLRLCEGDK